MRDTFGLAESYLAKEERVMELHAEAVWEFVIAAIVCLLIFCASVGKGCIILAFLLLPAGVYLAARRLVSRLEK